MVFGVGLGLDVDWLYSWLRVGSAGFRAGSSLAYSLSLGLEFD